MASEQKQYGRTYTPEVVSQFLTEWAIQSSDDSVLEPSVGEGQFVFDSFERLQDLGATDTSAINSIYGIDIDTTAINRLQDTAKRNYGLTFPNIKDGNLFNTEFQRVDAIVGNPPYVVRHRFENPETIVDRFSDRYGFTDQADLYCYFIAQAAQLLQPGGRFGMIVSNSWMKKRYGEEFKQFLLQEFDIHALIGFNERVFSDLTNSICILAEKKPNTIRSPDSKQVVTFIQAENTNIFDDGDNSEPLKRLQQDAIHVAQITQSTLDPQDYWDIWLRAPDVFEALETDDRFVPLNTYAKPKIGVQTLAKDFYVLAETDTNKEYIESQFLKPVAYSSRDHQDPIIEKKDCEYFLFWCPYPKDELAGTNALRYIQKAEDETFEKRYSDQMIEGLHNKDRIKQTSRSPWYNLTEEAERRLPAQILLPRRVYKNYIAVWNTSQVIPNENFLATKVYSQNSVKPLLTYLNSTLGELCLRLAGQVYGGGVCDLNVSSAKQIQCLDLDAVSESALRRLDTAFDTFIETNDRTVLDRAIFEVLQFDEQRKQEVKNALEFAIQESVNKRYS